MFRTLKDWYYGTKCHLILASYLELVLVYLRIRKEAEKEDDFVSDRKSICEICDYNNEILEVRVCTVCSCPIQAKVIKIYSICPENKWQK